MSHEAPGLVPGLGVHLPVPPRTAHPGDVAMIVNHAPLPGPKYWDWRCLRCGLAVSAHAGWFKRLLWRLSLR